VRVTTKLNRKNKPSRVVPFEDIIEKCVFRDWVKENYNIDYEWVTDLIEFVEYPYKIHHEPLHFISTHQIKGGFNPSVKLNYKKMYPLLKAWMFINRDKILNKIEWMNL
jgi:hypothetical protein